MQNVKRHKNKEENQCESENEQKKQKGGLLKIKNIVYFDGIIHLNLFSGSSPELPEASNLSGLDMTQLALWNLYNGVVKPPLQQTPVLPFQQPRPQSQNSATEAPLDLGKSRKEERVDRPTTKRESPDDDVVDEEDQNESEETESESDEEDDCPLQMKNSSQGENSCFPYKTVSLYLVN